MYYLFDKTGLCIVKSESQLTVKTGEVLINVKEYYNPWEIELVNGGIKLKEVEEPTPEEPTIVVEDEPNPVTIDNVALLELLAELFEEIELLKGE